MIPQLLSVSLLLTLSTTPSLQISTVDSVSYIGAVVEYHPVTDGYASQMIAETNANNYRTIIKSALTYHTDIIVFPEFGLTSLPKDGYRDKMFSASEYRAYYRDTASHIPNPNEKMALCDNNSKYAKSLQIISCAAREFNMYVVVNHLEKVDCSPKKPDCAMDGFLLYNTNVVFDREGRVTARYRKYNPFNEFGTNVTAQPEVSTFRTDFGVTFGQFICFDLLHQKPATYFANNPNVTDVIFSTHWFDYPPFLEATEIQAAWAYAADVNFLASGYSDALTASGGSGIYIGKGGPIKIHHPRETTNALIVAEIPKLNRRQRIEHVQADKSHVHVFTQEEIPTILGILKNATNSIAIRDYLHLYTSLLLDTGKGSHITTLCDRELCCDFHVEMSYDKELAAKPGAKEYRYRLVVFDGVTNFGNVTTAGLEVCALVSCAGDSLDDCGNNYPDGTTVITPTSFDKLIITRRADLERPAFFVPTTLQLGTLVPLSSADFAYLTSGQQSSSLLLMYLVRPRSDLATFGMYGRCFDKDGQPATTSDDDESVVSISTVLMALLTFAIIVGSLSFSIKIAK